MYQAEGGFALERTIWSSLSERHVRGEWFVGEMDAVEAAALVEMARGAPTEGVSAKDMWPRPKCECHGEPMWWAMSSKRRAGGYWRCAVRARASARRSHNRDHIIEGLYVVPSNE